MKKAILILLLSVLFFVFGIQTAPAQDHSSEFLDLFHNSKPSLSGLEVGDYKKLGLLISIPKIWLIEERIRAKCELRLRQAGIEPTEPKWPNTYLLVNIQFLSEASSLSLHFKQTVVFAAQGTIYRQYATTWEKSFLGIHGNDEESTIIVIDEMFDAFLKEYLKANQKDEG